MKTIQTIYFRANDEEERSHALAYLEGVKVTKVVTIVDELTAFSVMESPTSHAKRVLVNYLYFSMILPETYMREEDKGKEHVYYLYAKLRLWHVPKKH